MRFGFDAGASAAASSAVAAVLAAAFIAHAKASRAGPLLTALRAAGVAALALTVMGPAVVFTQSHRVKPRLLVFLDAGSSMRGKSGSGTRWSQSLDWLDHARGAIQDRAQVSFVLLTDRARPVADFERLRQAEPENTTFSPASALADFSAAGPSPARIWLISDGVVEGAGEPARLWSDPGVPVDVLGVGPSRREKGTAIIDLKTPDFAFLRDKFEVGATLAASGLAGRRIALSLSRADPAAPNGWRQTAQKELRPLSDAAMFTSTFSAGAERLGAERWRLESRVDAVAHSREFRVEVVRQKYRIMYLAGRPSHEYAFLREFLKSDPNRELVSFVILRNPENPSPADERELSLIPFPMEDIFVRTLPQFDLFILENFSAARFRLPPAYMEQLKRFVANGGALLVKGGENAFSAGGYRGSPLEEILPVQLSSRLPDFMPGLFAPRPTSWEHPMVKLFDTADESRKAWDSLPSLDGWGRFAATRSSAHVIAVHPSEKAEDGSPLPVIAARPFGRGKVMLISTDSTWRWKLGASGDRLAAGVYERFWARVVQYLTGSLDLSKVKFAPLPDRVVAREPFSAAVRVFDNDFGPAPSGQTRLQILWTSPSGETRQIPAREVEPGAYAVEITGLSRGVHRLRAAAKVRGASWGSDEISFVWEPSIDAPMDRAWLTRAATAGGGGFFDLAQTSPGELLKNLPAAAEESEVVRLSHPFRSVPWLALTACLLIAEWAWRRWRGHA